MAMEIVCPGGKRRVPAPVKAETTVTSKQTSFPPSQLSIRISAGFKSLAESDRSPKEASFLADTLAL